MSIGTGIALFVIGTILAYAVNVDLAWINLDLVGYLLMGAGVVVFMIGIVLLARRRQAVTTVQSGVDPASGSTVTERRTTVSGDEVA